MKDTKMTYESWRCTYQDSELAARSAYKELDKTVGFLLDMHKQPPSVHELIGWHLKSASAYAQEAKECFPLLKDVMEKHAYMASHTVQALKQLQAYADGAAALQASPASETPAASPK